MSEDARRATTLVLAWGSWTGLVTIVILRSTGMVGQEMGLIAVPLLGIAIAASLARSRMRLSDTIAGVFAVALQQREKEVAEMRAMFIRLAEDGHGEDALQEIREEVHGTDDSDRSTR